MNFSRLQAAPWLEVKYLGILSSRLRNFKRKSAHVWNFSCPICGDSQKSKKKARGYVYEKDSSYRFTCKNCGAGSSLRNLIKTLDPTLYGEFLRERIAESGNQQPLVPYRPAKADEGRDRVDVVEARRCPLDGIYKITELPDDHFARSVLSARRISGSLLEKFYFAPQFFTWVNEVVPGKYEISAARDEPRIVIPYLDHVGRLHAFTGREIIGKSKSKYIRVVVDDSLPSVYNYCNVDPEETVYVFEGEIDSMFVPNSIATGGGVVQAKLGPLDLKRPVVVYDNDRRNREVVRNVERAIDTGYEVVIWPNRFRWKDCNEAIQDGIHPDDLLKTLEQNTFSGPRAKLALSSWKRI